MFRVKIFLNGEEKYSGRFQTNQEASSWVFEDSQPWLEKINNQNSLKDGFSYSIEEENVI